MMTKLDAWDVEWLRAFTLCCFKDALGLNEHELRTWSMKRLMSRDTLCDRLWHGRA